MIKFKNGDFFLQFKNIKAELGFLTLKVRQKFIKLREVFVKAPVFYYFNPEYYIKIEIDISRYIMSRILSQLTFYYLD